MKKPSAIRDRTGFMKLKAMYLHHGVFVIFGVVIITLTTVD